MNKIKVKLLVGDYSTGGLNEDPSRGLNVYIKIQWWKVVWEIRAQSRGQFIVHIKFLLQSESQFFAIILFRSWFLINRSIRWSNYHRGGRWIISMGIDALSILLKIPGVTLELYSWNWVYHSWTPLSPENSTRTSATNYHRWLRIKLQLRKSSSKQLISNKTNSQFLIQVSNLNPTAPIAQSE